MDKLDKLHDTQEKAEQNKKHQGKGNPGKKLPNKQHGTNK
ncbi:MAG: HemX protein [Desulfosporosinus sp. BRH_c37]|nr:MAG: HemX protein [Desulfosporosinus sp. BRH_c37]